MDDSKVCSKCGGVVDVTIIRKERADGTFVSYAEGLCRSCGCRFEEGELLALEGTGPIGG